MIVRSSGWTLIETMVAVGLAAMVMTIVTHTLLSTSRVTKAQTQRSIRQATLQTAMRHLENALQRSAVAGVSWHTAAPTGAVLATHPLVDTTAPATPPPTQPFWRCFVWDQQARTLTMGESLDPGGLPAPSTTRFQAMPNAQLQAILDNETPTAGTHLRGRRVADRVTDFVYRLDIGPLYHIELELDVPKGDDPGLPDAQERLRARLDLHPRNRM